MIVLDTHAWIWWVDDHPRLRRSVRDQIDSENDVRVCATSLLEIATAVSLGRLALRASVRYHLQIAQSAEQARIERLTDALCLRSASLPGAFHRDPADRLVVALARTFDAELVTADFRIPGYSHVKTLAAE